MKWFWAKIKVSGRIHRWRTVGQSLARLRTACGIETTPTHTGPFFDTLPSCGKICETCRKAKS